MEKYVESHMVTIFWTNGNKALGARKHAIV